MIWFDLIQEYDHGSPSWTRIGVISRNSSKIWSLDCPLIGLGTQSSWRGNLRFTFIKKGIFVGTRNLRDDHKTFPYFWSILWQHLKEVNKSFTEVTFWCILFVHDGINSVADYNSLRVGFGWMSVPRQISWWDNFKRLEILSWNFVWCLILMICLGNEPMVKIGPPQPSLPPYPLPNACDGLTSTIFV